MILVIGQSALAVNQWASTDAPAVFQGSPRVELRPGSRVTDRPVMSRSSVSSRRLTLNVSVVDPRFWVVTLALTTSPRDTDDVDELTLVTVTS